MRGSTELPAHPALLRPARPAGRAAAGGGAPARDLRRGLERRRGVRQRAHAGHPHHPPGAGRRPARAAVHPHGVAARLPLRLRRHVEEEDDAPAPASPPPAAAGRAPSATGRTPLERPAGAADRCDDDERARRGRGAPPDRAPRRRSRGSMRDPATSGRAPICATRDGTCPAPRPCLSSALPAGRGRSRSCSACACGARAPGRRALVKAATGGAAGRADRGRARRRGVGSGPGSRMTPTVPIVMGLLGMAVGGAGAAGVGAGLAAAEVLVRSWRRLSLAVWARWAAASWARSRTSSRSGRSRGSSAATCPRSAAASRAS